MLHLPFALQFLVVIASGWVNRRQQLAIEYLLEENRVLREQLGSRRLRLTDAQRRRLAVRGKALGRKALDELAGLVTPATILRWYRTLVARKYDGSKSRGIGRPPTPWCPKTRSGFASVDQGSLVRCRILAHERA